MQGYLAPAKAELPRADARAAACHGRSQPGRVAGSDADQRQESHGQSPGSERAAGQPARSGAKGGGEGAGRWEGSHARLRQLSAAGDGGEVQIDCPVTRGYTDRATKTTGGLDVWGLEKAVRLRLWPAARRSSIRGHSMYPAKQRWFASQTQMANEPVYVDGGEKPGMDASIYYHYGLDIGGAEGLGGRGRRDERSGRFGRQGSAAGLCRYAGLAAYDVIYLLDDRGWFYRYSHLHTIRPEIGRAQRSSSATAPCWSWKGFNVVASDAMAMLQVTDQYVELMDKEIVIVTKDQVTIQNLNGEVISRAPYKAELDASDIEKGTYPHYMLKEIDEQPLVMRRIIQTYQNEQGELTIDSEIINALMQQTACTLLLPVLRIMQVLLESSSLKKWRKFLLRFISLVNSAITCRFI